MNCLARQKGSSVPPKKTSLTDAERIKRIREAAREHETDNDPASFERAFAKVVVTPPGRVKTDSDKK
jgi:hypothetical protein